MTWVGILAVIVLTLALVANVVQYKAYASWQNKAQRKYLIGGWAIGVLLNVILLIGILFVGTGPLF